jgi:predicted PurR-regulated permease PerM
MRGTSNASDSSRTAPDADGPVAVEFRSLIRRGERRVEWRSAVRVGEQGAVLRLAMTETRFRQAFLLLLVTAISAAFVAMIRAFLLTILLAAIFTGLSYPVYRWLLGRLRGREGLAAIATLVLLLALVIAPLLAVLGAGANEALRVTETLGPRLEQLVDQPGEFDSRLRAIPGYHRIEPYRAQILTKAGELLGSTSTFLFAALSATTRATAIFVFQFFVLLYTMFFFLTGGPSLLRAVLSYLPLFEADKQRMLEKFVSVTRATLKGTILIGAAQGVLGGLAFWAVSLDGAIFWGTVMTVLSIIPGVGSALIWVPAAIILIATGEVWRGIALALFCALVVGSVDNVLRPRLVGQDTKMHELLIFFSTLGGLMLFGAMGFILGPILAALFVTVWEMFGTAFRSALAEPGSAAAADPDYRPPA